MQLSIVIKTGENHNISVEYAKAKLFVYTVFPDLYRWDKHITTVGNGGEELCEHNKRYIIRGSVVLQPVIIAIDVQLWGADN